MAWVFQILHICHKSKREIVILKLDIKKSFDKVEHKVIQQIFKIKRFPDKLAWLRSIFLQVLLQSCKPFKCKTGVRQSDPFYPLLFVMATDLLHSVVHDAASKNELLLG